MILYRQISKWVKNYEANWPVGESIPSRGGKWDEISQVLQRVRHRSSEKAVSISGH